MKKAEEMKVEYDFSNKSGTRGKYHKAYKEGYSVRIYDGEKLVSDNYYASIEADVREFFPNSESINKALRSLIKLIPQKSRT